MMPPPARLEPGEREAELVAAVAAPRAEHIPGEASRVQPHRNRARKVGRADDHGDRPTPGRVAKNDESCRQLAIERHLGLARNSQRLNGDEAETGDRIGVHGDDELVVDGGRRLGFDGKQGREPLRQLGKLDRSKRGRAGRRGFDDPIDIDSRNERQNGIDVVGARERERHRFRRIDFQAPWHAAP